MQLRTFLQRFTPRRLFKPLGICFYLAPKEMFSTYLMFLNSTSICFIQSLNLIIWTPRGFKRTSFSPEIVFRSLARASKGPLDPGASSLPTSKATDGWRPKTSESHLWRSNLINSRAKDVVTPAAGRPKEFHTDAGLLRSNTLNHVISRMTRSTLAQTCQKRLVKRTP